MDVENALNTADQVLFENTGQHLTTLERAVLQGCLEQKSYKSLASKTYRSPATLKDIGAQLWRKLSIALEVPVKKNTVKAELERFQSTTGETISAPPTHRYDWADAPDVNSFFGRREELETLQRWILADRCRLVAIVGMRGIGKTGLTIKLGTGGIGKTDLSLQLAHGIQREFDCVIWRSLLNAPPVASTVGDLVQFISNHQQVQVPENPETQIVVLLEHLKRQRCLLILDNLESVMVGQEPSTGHTTTGPRSMAGEFRVGFEGYGQLIQKIAEVSHQSCLILTSREQPKLLKKSIRQQGHARIFPLTGLNPEDATQILLDDQAVVGKEDILQEIIRFYEGNPLALSLVAKRIQNIFNGSIAEFLEQDNLFFEDIDDLLGWHIQRLSPHEEELLYWLAINRESVPVTVLKGDCLGVELQDGIADVLESLQRRIPIIRSVDGFTLQPVIIEYMTARLIVRVWQEIQTGELDSFNRICLQKSSVKTYVRESQQRLVVQPLLNRLIRSEGRKSAVIDRLNQTLEIIKRSPTLQRGYAAGNLITLLLALEADLNGYDFSHLTIRQAYLQDARLENVNLSHADLSTAQFRQSFGGIHALAFSSDGQYLAAGDSKGQIRLLQCSNHQQVGLLVGHIPTLWVTSLAFSKQHPILVSCSFDQTVRIWDIRSGTCLKVLTGHSHWLWAAALSPDGQRIASGGDDCTIRLWDVNTGECLNVLTDHTNWVWAVAFSPDGKTLASGSYDHTIRLWDVATGQCLHVLEGHQNSVWSLAFSPNGKMLASGSLDFSVRLWELDTCRCVKTLSGHGKEVRSIAFSPDGKWFVSGSFDGTLKRWDTATGRCLNTYVGHRVGVRAIAVSPNGQMIASGDHAQSLRLWNPVSGNCLQAFYGYVNWVWSVDVSPDYTRVATAGLDGLVRIWSIQTGECLHVLEGHGNWIWQVAFCPDGKTLASCSDDETIKLWDTDNGRCLDTLKGHRNGGVWAIDYYRSGKTLISGGQDGTLRIWDLQTSAAVRTVKAHDNWIWAVRLNEETGCIASCSDDGTIKIWDAETLNLLFHMALPERKVLSLAFIHRHHLLASGHDDGTIRFWNVLTGEQVDTFEGHTGWVLSLAFDFERNILVSTSQDKLIKIWDMATGECLRDVVGHQNWVTSMQLCPSINALVSGGTDETLKIWDLDTAQCRRTVKLPLPYEGMNIDHTYGLTDSQKENLKSLGAISSQIATN